MTYCVGIRLDAGLVFLSDSRTNAGLDQIGTFRKMQVYEVPVGWYSTYDANRTGYDMSDLQLLPGNDLNLWMSVPADGSLIHCVLSAAVPDGP